MIQMQNAVYTQNIDLRSLDILHHIDVLMGCPMFATLKKGPLSTVHIGCTIIMYGLNEEQLNRVDLNLRYPDIDK